jgi:hypothetical protein
MRLEAEDFTLEPDANLPTYAAYARFIERQDGLARLSGAEVVRLVDASGGVHAVAPASHRPLGSLPADFWVQVVVGLFAWLISVGVWPSGGARRARATSCSAASAP